MWGNGKGEVEEIWRNTGVNFTYFNKFGGTFAPSALVSMAKVVGNIKPIGTIDNICFYQMNGEFYARVKSNLTAKRVKTDPKFKNSQLVAQEFGWSAKIGKTIRRHWLPLKPYMDKSVHFRFQHLLHQIIQKGNGTKGMRTLDLKNAPDILHGFKFNKSTNLQSIIDFKTILPSSLNSSSLSVSLTHFSAKKHVPNNITHFKIGLQALTVSPFEYDTQSNQYTATSPHFQGMLVQSYSPPIPIDHSLTGLSHHFNLNFMVNLPPEISVLLTLSLEFFCYHNQQYTILETGKTAEIIQVY
ncbi:MAG: hypothetical protein ACWA41_00375 [Putridiphycobacter sp.]